MRTLATAFLSLIVIAGLFLAESASTQDEELIQAGRDGLSKRGWVLLKSDRFVKGPTKIEVGDSDLAGRTVNYVAFFVDGELVAVDEVPPFAVLHDFGAYTHKAQIVAIGYQYEIAQPEPEEVSEAEEIVEQEEPAEAEVRAVASDAVRIVAPGAGQYAYGTQAIRAEVDAPADSILRVDFSVDGRSAGSVSAPPYEVEYDFGRGFEGRRVRAVAVLTDGRQLSAELTTTPLEGSDYFLRTRLVTLDATVLDWRDRLIGDLKREEFRVFEDGAEQEITHFSIEERPLRVALLIDTSSSMVHNNRMARAKEAAIGFLSYLKPEQDKVALIQFFNQIEVLSPFTDRFGKVGKMISELEPAGGTAIHDALYNAARLFDDETGRKAIILLTDGQDEHSGQTIGDAVETVRRAGVKVYSIGIFEEDVIMQEAVAPPPTTRTKHPNVDPEDARRTKNSFRKGSDPRKVLFIGLADETGGAAFFPGDLKNLPGVFERIALELRNAYSIGYSPTNQELDGKWRKIDLKTTRGGLTVRAKTGYYAEK